MNYYIQGDEAKASQIKAAFERLGYDITYPDGCANPAALNIGVEIDGAKFVVPETLTPYGDEFAQLFPEGDFKVYTKDELDFHVDVNWQQVRIQASIAVMQGMIANPQTFEQLDHDERYKDIRGGDKLQIVAIASVMYADALIAELKKGGDK